MGTVTTKRSKVFDEVTALFGRTPEWLKQVPDPALEGLWGQMRDFYLAQTTIPNKYKDLIGLAVSGATRCRYCTLFHTESARLNGATDVEIAEAATMGAFTMESSTFINAMQVDYEQFKRETLDIVKFVKQQKGKGAPGVQPHA
ncbi:MAG: alkylhydroperoxidase [Deltaproteobacteria bacterium RBG_16_71_12]|nr:MAG: alkylhydroperoxidase [Deltaproteobacteria bacterium RBG_16_71_12]